MNITTYLPVNKQQAPNPHPTSVFQQFIYLIFFLCGSFTIHAATNNSPETEQKVSPLNLSLIPHLSSNLTIKKYSKFIIYLEEVLKHPVIIVTAPNYKSYITRNKIGEAATTYNRMTDNISKNQASLKQSKQQIQQLNEELERRVAQRTEKIQQTQEQLVQSEKWQH